MGPVMTAVFDDTCRNLIELASRLAERAPASPSPQRRFVGALHHEV